MKEKIIILILIFKFYVMQSLSDNESYYESEFKKIFGILNHQNKLSNNCSLYINETFSKFVKIFNLTNPDGKYLKNNFYKEIFYQTTFRKNKFSAHSTCTSNMFHKYFMLIIETNNIDYFGIKNVSSPKEYIDYEQTFFLYGICLPWENDNEKNCTVEDYKTIVKGVNEDLNFFLFPSNAEPEIHLIEKDTSKIIFGFILLGLLSLQVFLVIFNYPIFIILKKIFRKKKEINNEDNVNESSYNEIHKNKYIIPKWLLKFNNIFSFSDNVEELFNIKSNSTEMNNYSGLSEIRGLNSLSIIFSELGFTFIVIYNSPLKLTGTEQIRKLFSHYLYIFFFIGLRYSPRIIISCSGYTLAYKYLSFIDKNLGNFSVIKFISYQFHKFLILIFSILFLRYTLNAIYIIYYKEIFPYWYFFQQKILENYNKYKFWLSFIGLDLFFEDKTKKSDQNLSDYLWLPYNEIYFFIFGVTIITIGYKYKLKIDIFILIIILSVLIFKITFSYLYRKGQYYSTLYYYLLDYGKFMESPLFNLTYFLIGFYFGFINFGLQKGATSQFDTSIYEKIEKFSFVKSNDEEENNALKENIDDKNNFEQNNEKNNIDNSINNKDEKSGLDQNNEIVIDGMPFLNSIVKYINFEKKHKIYKIYYFIVFLIISSPIILHYSFINYFLKESNKIKESFEEDNYIINDKQKLDDFYSAMNLYKYISNTALNIIFRIDIEIFIFLIYWLFFILNIKGKSNILIFFTHISWGIFNKPSFTFEVICSMIILFIIYSTETFISVNVYTLFLYFIFHSVIIFILTCIIYIFFELPMKKMIKTIFNSDDNENEYEDDNFISQNNDEEEEEKEEEDKEVILSDNENNENQKTII